MTKLLSIKKFSISVLGYYNYYLILDLCKHYNVLPFPLPGRKYPRFYESQVQELIDKMKNHSITWGA